MTIAALKNRTLSAAIIDRLRKDILDGTHPDGTPLRQDALAGAYGVSRIPVREALFQLEAEGLVRMVPHKGAVVTGLTAAEIDDVFGLRGLLETRLLNHSVPLLTAEDFAAIDALQHAFAEAIRQHDAGRWGELNASLHLALYRRADLPRTQGIVAQLLTTSERYTRIQLATKAAWRRARDEHAQLIALCRARETDRACALLVAHIDAVHRDLAAMLRRRVTAPPP